MTGFDPTPLLQTIDRMGAGLAVTSKDVEGLRGQVAELRMIALSNLIALQYILGQHRELAEWLKTQGVDVWTGNVNDMMKFFSTRIPR